MEGQSTINYDQGVRRAHQMSPTILYASFVAAAYINDMTTLLGTLGLVDPSVHDSEALRVAAGRGNHEIVRALLADGRSDPSARLNAAFRLACASDSLETIVLLLGDPRVDPTARESEGLRYSVCRGERAANTVALLLHDGRSDLRAVNHAAFRKAPRGPILNLVMVSAAKRGIHYGVLE